MKQIIRNYGKVMFIAVVIFFGFFYVQSIFGRDNDTDNVESAKYENLWKELQTVKEQLENIDNQKDK